MTDRVSVIRTDHAPSPVGPYSQAVLSDGYLFVSGQIGIEPRSGALVEGGAGSQMEMALQNLSAIVSASGASLRDVLRISLYLKDMNDFGEVNKIYANYFSDWRPARSTIGGLQLPKGALVEIDAIVKVDG